MNGLSTAYLSRLRGVEIDMQLVENLRSAVLVLRSTRAANDRAAANTGHCSDTPEQAHAAYLAAKRTLHEGCTI